jgi:hypothetical protein
MIHCHVCGKPKSEICGDCSKTAKEIGSLEILWDGLVAMSAEVALCPECDGAWLRLASRSPYVCCRCRRRALRVEIKPETELRRTVKVIAA